MSDKFIKRFQARCCERQLNLDLVFRSLVGDVVIDLLLEAMSVRPSVLPFVRAQKVFSSISLQCGVWVDLSRMCASVWLRPDPRSWSRSRSFWSSENCTFLGLSPPPFWQGAQNWWLMMTVWVLVYSLSEPDFCISSPLGGHVASKFVKCWYHQARSLWLWLQVGRNKPCSLAAMTVSPLAGFLFCVHFVL